MTRFAIIITFFLVLVVHKESFSQQIINKELDLSQDLSIWYDSVAGLDKTVLRQGILADLERKALHTHPFLYDFKWQLGDVLYQDQQFKNVMLIYNLEEDVLLTMGEGISRYTQFIELKSDRISNFRIRNSKYKWMNESIQRNDSGFYEILYEGDQLDLIAKRTKTLNLNDAQLIYEQKDEYYVHYQNEYFTINNSGDLSRKFKSNRRLIKDFARQNQIRKLNAEVDHEFIALIKFCDDLEL